MFQLIQNPHQSNNRQDIAISNNMRDIALNDCNFRDTLLDFPYNVYRKAIKTTITVMIETENPTMAPYTFHASYDHPLTSEDIGYYLGFEVVQATEWQDRNIIRNITKHSDYHTNKNAKIYVSD